MFTLALYIWLHIYRMICSIISEYFTLFCLCTMVDGYNELIIHILLVILNFIQVLGRYIVASVVMIAGILLRIYNDTHAITI